MTAYVDTIVAGGGTAGSAAAWHLARGGGEVQLLEARPVVDDVPARSFELTFADPLQHDLAAEAVTLWREFEAESSTPVLDRTGMVLHGPGQRIEAAADALGRAGLTGEIVSAASAESRWPALRFGGAVLFAPEGGRLRESAAITALQDAAESAGARITRGVTVTRIRILGDDRARLSVRATDAADSVDPAPEEVWEIECRRLVVALGPSTAKLLRGLVTLPRLTSVRDSSVVLPSVDVSAPAVLHLQDPTAPGQRFWRGDATVLGGDDTLVIGWRDTGAGAASSARSGLLAPRELAALLRYAREWVPGAAPELPVIESRVRTSAHDGDFVIDRIGPVTVGAGFGATGAGLAPAVGRLLAGLVEGVAAPSRFALRPDRRRAGLPPAAVRRA